MNKNLYCVFNSYPDREYAIVIDSVFNDEFSETLDSASIVITQVEENLRLSSLQVKSEIVYIYDKETNFSKYMLVDNYVEQIINIKDNVYKYTINLMSLTKLLETIQCPNLVITHSLVSGQKKISQYIKQYVEVYSPKVKMKVGDKWEYQPLINIDDELIDNKFNQKCRDLAFTNNTLREVLTTLMIQQQCIPTLDVRTSTGKIYLSWLDLNEKRETFVKSSSINYIQKSMASDSYVNNLVYMNDNVLDDNNSVISEHIGFRDTSNALLSQTGNYKLYTTYPIYDVKSVIINTPCKVHANTYFNLDKIARVKISETSTQLISLFMQQNGGIKFYYSDGVSSINTPIYIHSGNFYCFYKQQLVFVSEPVINKNLYPVSTTSDGDYLNRTFTPSQFTQQWDYVFIGTFTCNGIRYENVMCLSTSENGVNLEAFANCKIDISKLVVENSKRNLLDTDYVKMQNEDKTIDKICNYRYGTFHYSIGSNEISGFSDTFNIAILWWNNTYTVLENLLDIIYNQQPINDYKQETEDYFYNGLDLKDYISFEFSSISKKTYKDAKQFFMGVYFNITYQPLNTLRLEISKDKDIPFNVSQFDSSSNSITNLEYLGIAGLEKVNRYGNEILAIHQRTTNANDIQPLNSLYEDNYIVFKRTIDYSYGAYVVNYICAKDYILKNYFTSIETKYRAYEYISYGSTTIRKENTHIYARIGYNYYDGDDYIKFKTQDINQVNFYLNALLPIDIVNKYNQYKLSGMGVNDLYKSDLSIATFNTTMILNTQAFDSVSYGIYVDVDSEYFNKVGGIVQSWYINDNDRDKIKICFGNKDNIDAKTYYGDEDDYNEMIRDVYKVPKVRVINPMYVVDDNTSDDSFKTFYLDQSEVLNYTLQIDYYTNDESIVFNKNIVDFNTMKVGKLSGKKYLVSYSLLSNIDFNESAYNDLGSYQTMEEITTSNCVYDANSITYESLQNFRQYKVVYKENGLYYDLIKFSVLKQPTETFVSQTIYITLNDTRSDRVGSYVEVNGNLLLTFNKCNVKTNNLQREIEGV